MVDVDFWDRESKRLFRKHFEDCDEAVKFIRKTLYGDKLLYVGMITEGSHTKDYIMKQLKMKGW